jgi:hypothetical protein
LLVAVRNLDFLGFPLGILMEFTYEMSTARRDLSNNDLFGIYTRMVYVFIPKKYAYSAKFGGFGKIL